MINDATPPQTRFLHTLARSARGYYPLAGREWMTYGHDTADALHLQIPEYDLGHLFLDVHADRMVAQRFVWIWECKLHEDVYACVRGFADTAEAAAAAAVAYRPEDVIDEVSGQRWLRLASSPGEPTELLTHFDGERATVQRWETAPGDNYWTWMRSWPPAEALAALVTGRSTARLRGLAKTPALAMLAAEHAPDDLRRACMELIAATRPQSKPDRA